MACFEMVLFTWWFWIDRRQIFQIDFSLMFSAFKYFIFGEDKMNTFQSTWEGKKGWVEPFQMKLIFDANNLCTDICKTIFVILEVQFHHEGGLSKTRYFELFFSAWSIFSPNISPYWGPLQPFLNIDYAFGHICFLKKSYETFWYKIWVIIFTKSAKLSYFGVPWVRNNHLLLYI